MTTNRTFSLLFAPLLLLAARPLAEAPTVTRTAFVKIESKLDLAAPPGAVWTALTSAKGLAALGGFQLAESDRRMAKVGDAMKAKVWSDDGDLVVTHAAEGRELRLAFEPANASYVCTLRVRLEPAGKNGSRLLVLDRYSDDQLETVEKTAKEAAAEMASHLEAFRTIVLKP